MQYYIIGKLMSIYKKNFEKKKKRIIEKYRYIMKILII